MGTFNVTIHIGDPQGQHYESLEALADTGASHTVVPRHILERLGVAVRGRWPFTLADDRVVEHNVGQTFVQIDDSSFVVPVVFGESSSAVLLGASTLEIFLLAVDPVHKRLVPVSGLLMRIHARA